MKSKVIIGLLVFFVILSGGLYGYSYILAQQIRALSGQLEVIKREQAAQISEVSNELVTFRGEALTEIGNLSTDIDTLGDTLGGAMSQLGTLEGELGMLEGELKGMVADLSQSVVRADEVYRRVSKAAVTISDGERTIGSGFVLGAKGHVVTANHVIEQLSSIYVVLSDGRSSKATVVGSDEYSDIAVLRLEDEQLVVEPSILADSSSVRIGEPVVAIGNPFDLTETLTSGIVSQLNRFIEIEYDAQTRWVANIIQFDAAVNFGNSGGPLFNSQGEVIGMVVARVSPVRGEGIYYAVSANKVKRVAAALIARGSFDYPWVGIVITDLTPSLAQDRALETVNGVLVEWVAPESPAEAGGIIADDIIIAVDTIPVRDMGQLQSYLGEFKSPGDSLSVTLIRESKEREVSLRLDKRSP